MNIYARISNGIVIELLNTEVDPATLFNPALQWVPVTTPGVQAGWVHGSTGFSAPPPIAIPATLPITPSLSQLQAELATLTSQIAALAAKSGG